ncbi:MAG: bifunctional histidinol-phosphatase/imidazoleglycerol-phosphate dehydratase HisB [Saprospiraceae bacterium]|nr:bifunctional histidinol-phosphatase/imidazoleglycerol-phosphate dehydratase HisB [Saprospiraceae bacterium]
MKKVLFIDRDGTLVIEPSSNQQVDSLEKLEFYPGVFQHLSRIATEMDYLLVMVTNQDGLGTPSFPEESFWSVQEKIITAFRNEGIHFHEILIDRSFSHQNLDTRKPGTGMLTHYLKSGYDLANSFVIGDRLTDIKLAKNIGCQAIYLSPSANEEAALTTISWKDIWLFLSARPRIAVILRETLETRIEIELNLDGSGICHINTGLGFFDHMLEQVARHGLFDLRIQVHGDLHIDEHHTIEDVAITLGEAFYKAIGNKRGIERYGFLLPMDDCLAQVAIDFGGRPWLVWEAIFAREKIGDLPTEMFMHFFKSFSDHAKCNLNIKAEGTIEHHKIESIFKAFARAAALAVRKSAHSSIPSTKGIL